MNSDKFLNILIYSIPILALAVIMWGPQIHAMNDTQVRSPPLYSSAQLSAEPIQPIPKQANVNKNIAALGEDLFEDTRLSESNVSCRSCHNLDTSGNDGLKVSINIKGGNDNMNTPTIFNASLNPLLTWYGRNKTLEEQVDNVISNKKHMNGNWKKIIQNLKKDDHYINQFNSNFSDGITRSNVKFSIASYERTLITPDAPFDDFLRGNSDAISSSQKDGYKLFKQYGCISCHQGINIGGNLHAKLGTFSNPFTNQIFDAEKRKFNLGRYNLTKEEKDKHVFRVPSLRNVEVTSPYFHSGGITDLTMAVKFMAKYQTGRDINNNDALLITEFLRSLTGKYKNKTLTSQYIVKDASP